MKEKVLAWLDRDLRIQDNQIFQWLSKNCHVDVSFVAFDLEPAVSEYQRLFYYQSIQDLNRQLKSRNLEIFLFNSRPEKILPELLKCNSIDIVLVSKRYNHRSIELLEKIKKLSKVKFIQFEQSTLLLENELPFSIDEFPLVFTQFRKAVEKNFNPRLDENIELTLLNQFDLQIVESFEPINIDQKVQNLSCKIHLPFDLHGGEIAGRNRILEYLFDTQDILTYKQTRNAMIEKNHSTKFSAWLAWGCISARQIYSAIKKFENDIMANDSTYWVVFELLWRDYFKFLSLKIGHKMFSETGISNEKYYWNQDFEKFESWANGKTANDFVDANMIELLKTGWMSNRGRQNVASYFSKELELNWTLGAQYFSEQLIDSDVESNWGNWMYVSGVGTDPRDRKFNIGRQAEIYDSDRSYRNKWLGTEGASKK